MDQRFERGEFDLNGKVRLINNRERILELHKRLHNEKNLENVVEHEEQPQSYTKPSRIRRSEVKKYLGEPLPLPYLTSPRESSPKNAIPQTVNNNKQSTTRRPFVPRKPLGHTHDNSSEREDIYKKNLKESLKNFQRSTSGSRISIDRVVQTEDDYGPSTPKLSRYPIEGIHASPLSFGGPVNVVKIESPAHKDLILNSFRLRNSSLTPDNTTKPLTKLGPPLQVSSEKITEPVMPKKDVRLNIISILGSPIVLFLLLILLYFQTYGLQDFINLQQYLQN